MDDIFGRERYIQTVIWRNCDNSNNDAKQFLTGSQLYSCLILAMKAGKALSWIELKVKLNITKSR
ncbi:MAG: hypothetical protein ACLUOO_03060 [Coprococcus sp.]